MRFSYSRVGVFENCPYRYKLQYIDKLKTIPETNADNALYLGLGLHKGIEVDVNAGVDEYLFHFNVLDDLQINWSMQLEYQIPKVKALLPIGGQHELEIKDEHFIGYIDYLADNTIFDFKFSNAVDRYKNSSQLSIYKYFLEKTNHQIGVDHLKFIMIPKLGIRQKKTENLFQFRSRMYDELCKTEIQVIEVPFDMDSVTHYLEQCKTIETNKDWKKCPSRLCNWCNFQKYCESDGKEDWMIL